MRWVMQMSCLSWGAVACINASSSQSVRTPMPMPS